MIKRNTFTLMGMLCLLCAGHAHAAETWALLVGVSKYQSPQIASLRFPAADAASMRDALTDAKLGGLAADHVKTLTDEDATAANIMGAVETFLKPNVKPGDRVIVSLAGHGVTKGVGVDAKSYLLPTDVKGVSSAALESSAVNFATLSGKLSELPASQFVVFVDACREDPTPGRGVKGNPLSDVLARSVQIVPQDADKPAASVIFFACGVGQRAYEDASFQHGVFTYWILDAIRAGAVPQRPDGAIDMGRLADYVKSKVGDWVKKASGESAFEIEQTPEMLASNVNSPVILVRVRRTLPETPFSPAPPRLLIAASPQGAEITVNGDKAGAGPVTEAATMAGEVKIKVEAPGYSPVERTIEALPGYEHSVRVELKPGEGARGVASDDKTDGLYRRALEAENNGQVPVAEAGYSAVLSSDPKYAPAYERLAALKFREGQNEDGVKTLLDYVVASPTVRSYGALAEGYAQYATRESISGKGNDKSGDKKNDEKPKKKRKIFGIGLNTGSSLQVGRFARICAGAEDEFHLPKDAGEAALLARKAAAEAVKLQADAPEAQRALGYSLTALDSKGANKKEALAAFGKAVFFAPKDATCQYALGYATRFYALQEKNDDTRNGQLKSAITALKAALDLRPNYYEAHRELAYCYHLLDDTSNATREYEAANANRGSASDPDEVAGLNVALGSLYMKDAMNSNGDTKTQKQAASAGYLDDARDITANLDVALRQLKMTGLGRQLTDFLPRDLQDVFNRLNIRLPDIPGIPGGNILRGKLPF